MVLGKCGTRTNTKKTPNCFNSFWIQSLWICPHQITNNMDYKETLQGLVDQLHLWFNNSAYHGRRKVDLVIHKSKRLPEEITTVSVLLDGRRIYVRNGLGIDEQVEQMLCKMILVDMVGSSLISAEKEILERTF